MGRRARVQYAGAVIHVWARRVDRSPLFVDDQDYEHYIGLLAKTVESFGWALLCFCLMPNHVHLMIELREPNLSEAMHALHRAYVRWFNDRHGRSGKLFEHRFHSRPVEDELYFATLVSYIEQNPVKASLAATPAGWRWSSRGILASGIDARWLADDVLQARRSEIRGT